MQLSIDFARAARRSDPATSHDAAARVREFAGQHHTRVLEGLRSLGGKAGAEQIGEAIGMLPHAVRRRTSELERAGLIRPTGTTVKTSSGRSERVWSLCQ